MKKILAICLAAVLVVFSFAACEQADAFELYQSAQSKMKDVKSLEMKVEGSIELSADGMSIPLSTEMDIKQVLRSPTDADIAMTVTANLEGTPVTTESYFTGGYLYTSANGTKVKTAMPLEDVLNSVGSQTPQFEESDFKTLTLETKDNIHTVKYEVSEEALTSMVDDLLNGVLSQMGDIVGDSVDMNLSIKTYSGEISMDKDCNMTAQRLSMQMEMTVMGQTMQVNYDLTSTILGLNSLEKIDFPADLDSYTEQAQ